MPKCRPLQLNITCGCPICPYHGTALAERILPDPLEHTMGSSWFWHYKIILSHAHICKDTENHTSIASTCSGPFRSFQTAFHFTPDWNWIWRNMFMSTETTQHFLFDCHLYRSLRAPILHSCRNIPWPPPLHFFTSSTHNLTILKSFIHNTKHL